MNKFNKHFEYVLISILFGIIYLFVGKLSLELSKVNHFVSIFWLPSGLSIGLLIYKKNLKYYLPIFIFSSYLEYQSGFTFWSSIFVGLGNIIEVFCALNIYFYLHKKWHTFLGHQTKIVSIFITSIASPIVASLIGAYMLMISKQVPSHLFLTLFKDWWAGNALGIFLIFPLVLSIKEYKISWVEFISVCLTLSLLYSINTHTFQPFYYYLIFLYLIPLLFDKIISLYVINLTIGIFLFWLSSNHDLAAQSFQQIYINSQSLLVSFGLMAIALEGFSKTKFVKSSLVIISIFWIVSAYLYSLSVKNEKNLDKIELDSISNKFFHNVDEKYNIFDNALRSIYAFTKISGKFNQESWDKFAETLKLKASYPEIDSYGIYLLKTDESFIYPSDRDTYFRTILHDDDIKKLLVTYSLNDIPIMSKRILLSPTDTTVSKSLFLMPIINKLEIIGWSFCVIDNEELFQSLLPSNINYSYETYDSNVVSTKNLLFKDVKISTDFIEKTETISFGNHVYTLIWKKISSFNRANFNLTYIYSITISIINILLLSYLFNIKVQRKNALDKNIILENQASDKEKRYRALFHESSDGIAILQNDIIIDSNPQFEKIFRVNKANSPLYFKSLFYSSQFSNKIIDQFILKKFINLETADHITFEAVCFPYGKIDEQFNAEIKIDKLAIADKTFFMASFVDISSRKKTEKNLIEAKEYAQEASKSKSRFLSNMSHEIRTPLNGIMGLLQLTLESDQSQNLTPSQIDNLKVAQFSAEHLIYILNEILDYSKIESGKITLEYRVVNFPVFLSNVLKIHQETASKKEVLIKLNIDSNIPEHLIIDEIRLGQIINNLISNAIKFTQTGSVNLNLQLIKKDLDNYKIQFDVIDTGIGIPQNKIDYIFNEFTQANEDHTRKYGGTGLGLPISKKLIELFGGEIKVESVENQGTKMSFLLTFKSANIEKVNENKEKLTSNNINFKGLKILLVEDNNVNVMVAKKYLEKWEIEVTVALDGLIAIEKVKEQNFNLILMDFHMPNMDGITATKKIREMEILTPIIGLSADVTSDMKDNFEKYGMNDFVSKPFKPLELSDKIKKYI